MAATNACFPTRHGIPLTAGVSLRSTAGKRCLQGQRDRLAADRPGIPPFVRPDGSNNGVLGCIRATLWWQNEDTARLPDKVDRLAFGEIAAAAGGRTGSGRRGLSRAAGPGRGAAGRFAVPWRRTSNWSPPNRCVADPIAFDWAPDGRLYVVEMRDYPEDMDEPNPPRRPCPGAVG